MTFSTADLRKKVEMADSPADAEVFVEELDERSSVLGDGMLRISGFRTVADYDVDALFPDAPGGRLS